MTTALDVATYLQTQAHPGRVGLQKLLYYARAWCLVELDEDCFPEPMQAWRMGPVVPAVYEAGAHLEGSPEHIPPQQRAVLEDVVAVYGALSGEELSELSHAEPGWLRARRGLEPDERGTNVIEFGPVVRFLREADGATPQERMRAALQRSRERAQLRRVMEPHRATMVRLAQ